MIKTIAAAAVMAAASLSLAGIAQAEDFPAAPMNSGPLVVHGMGPMGELVNVGLTPVNVVTKPVLDATGAVVGATPIAATEPAPAPVMMHHHHHHHHMMSKKKMMKKEM